MINAEPAVEYALEHPEQTATLLAALAGTATNYRATGKLPIGRLPWRALKHAWGEWADRAFGRTRPRGVPGLVVGADLETLERELRAVYFESADDVSFEYEAERLNLRRPNGTRARPVTGEPTPMELHPRAFELADGRVLVIAHDEASRSEAPGAHLRGTLLSWERGREDLAAVLDDRAIDFERVESERAAGLEVVP